MKKTVITFFLSFFALSLLAQTRIVQNQQLSDAKRIHFGFTLGLNFQDFGISHTNALDENNDTHYMEIMQYSPGFTVGVISDLKIFEFLNLRFVPTLNFGDRNVVFVNQNQIEAPKNQILKSTVLDFPLYLKYRADRINNYRPYFLVGGGLLIDLSRQKGEYILLKPADATIEVGVGCDFYLPYFKFSPELKFCLGLLDVLERDRSDLLITSDIKYTKAIDKLTSRMFVLTFNFE